MKIQAVSVCVNYSDFFCWSAIENKGLFDKWVVVTDTKDTKTAAICNANGITCIKTDVFYEGGGFNKYAGINEGLKHIDKDAWVLFLDADIALPQITKRIFNELNLQEDTLYGIDRVDCTGLGSWIKYCANPNMAIDNWLLTTGNMQLGARIVHYYGQQGDNGKFGGYKPLGFFQLAHRSSFDLYPQDSLGADHCDIVFANQYSRDKRALVPEIIGIHLESPNSKWGDNWHGRKSVSFDADIQVAGEQPSESKINTLLAGFPNDLVYSVKPLTAIKMVNPLTASERRVNKGIEESMNVPVFEATNKSKLISFLNKHDIGADKIVGISVAIALMAGLLGFIFHHS